MKSNLVMAPVGSNRSMLHDEASKDRASRGSRSRSRERLRNKDPESTDDTPNNDKTKGRSCSCRCAVEKQIQLVVSGDEAYRGIKFIRCNCDRCGPSLGIGRQRCITRVMEGFPFCGDCRGHQTVHDIFADMKSCLVASLNASGNDSEAAACSRHCTKTISQYQ